MFQRRKEFLIIKESLFGGYYDNFINQNALQKLNIRKKILKKVSALF